MHWWLNGTILACHAGGPGSIPGQCNLLSQLEMRVGVFKWMRGQVLPTQLKCLLFFLLPHRTETHEKALLFWPVTVMSLHTLIIHCCFEKFVENILAPQSCGLTPRSQCSRGALRLCLAILCVSQGKMRNASRICVSSLRRGHANLLCIVPILVYVLAN